MPPVNTDVTEDEVLAMFDKEGDLRDEPQSVEDDSAEPVEEAEEAQEEEADKEPEAKEEDEEEESEEESDEDSDEEEKEPSLDWSKIPAEHRAAHEADQKEIGKLRKDYGKLHSKYAELSQSRRQEDQTLEELRATAQRASQWEAILQEHPGLEDKIVELVKQAKNPIPDQVPDELKDDPAFKYMKERYEPYIKGLETKIKQLESQTKPLNDWQAEQQKAANRQKLDGLLNDAATEFKGMFGKDMTEDDKAAVLEYMIKAKYYEDGSLPVLKVFGDQYKKHLTAKNGADLKEKAKKFGSRTKTVNSRQASTAPKISSDGDAIRAAFADQGVDF